jgi:peptidoglycan/LPS O-acetylase OafA/YrhL
MEINTDPGPTASRRLVYIDCLRGIAALSVLLHHYIPGAMSAAGITGGPALTIQTTIYDYLDLGRFGVLLFFIISGYCIANSITKPATRPVISFIVNRFFRIFPAYWLSLAAAVLVFGSTIPPEVYAINISLFQFFLGKPDVLGVYWTLPVELTFYGFCAVLFVSGLMSPLNRLAIVCSVLFAYAVLAAVARFFYAIPLPYAWPFFLSLMLAGAVLRRLDASRGPRFQFITWTSVLGFLIGAFAISLCIYGNAAIYRKSWHQDFIAVSLSALLFVVVYIARRPRSGALAYCGKISFSIYLLQGPVAAAVSPWLVRHGIAEAIGFLGTFAVILSLTMAASSLAYFLVELPGIQLGHRLVSWLSSDPNQSAFFTTTNR